MKKLIIVFFALPFIALGQSKINGYVELTQKFPFSSLCFDSNISIGLSLLLKYGTIAS